MPRPSFGSAVAAAIVWLPLMGSPAFAGAPAQPPADSMELAAKGEWSPDVQYVADDIVTSRGSAWRAKRASKGKLPGSTKPSTAQDWEQLAAGFNPLGEWVRATTYHPGDLVRRQGTNWLALQTSKGKAPNANPALWAPFAEKGDVGPKGARGDKGAKGAIGAAGPQGQQGATGPEGAQGPQGPQGPQGAQGPAGPNSVANGSVGSPSIRFAASPNTGIFSPGAGRIALAANGALFLHDKGSTSTGLGVLALNSNTGSGNTAAGYFALMNNTTGGSNTAVGRQALFGNTAASSNTAVGANSMLNTSGSNNVAVGESTLTFGSGSGNVAVGYRALRINAGSSNIALGTSAGADAVISTSGIFIGNAGLPTDSATIRIGTGGTQTSAFVAGIRGATTGANDAVPVVIDSAGQLGTVSSSRRYKEDIRAMPDMTSGLMALRPVTFRYRHAFADGGKPVQYGLIAEEVAEVLPDLAVFNGAGQPETVKYHLLSTLLLDAYQRQQAIIVLQQQVMQDRAERLAALERRLDRLEAQLAQRVRVHAAAEPAKGP